MEIIGQLHVPAVYLRGMRPKTIFYAHILTPFTSTLNIRGFPCKHQHRKLTYAKVILFWLVIIYANVEHR